MTLEYYTPKEISKMFNIHYQKVLELIHLGKLESYKIDGLYKISSYALNQYLLSIKVKSFWKK